MRLLATALRALSANGELGALLDVNPVAAQTEEGWILGAGHVAELEAALR